MREPVVLSGEQVAVELVRLGGVLQTTREAAGLSTRDVASKAGMAQSTVWRVETGQHPPSFLSFARLVEAVDATLELTDGGPIRRFPVEQRSLALPPGYRVKPAIVYADWSLEKRQLHGRMHSVRVRLGAELWWARNFELSDPLDGEAACGLLGVSHHTLNNVEFGPKWPDLASLVLIAGLTGRSVALAPLSAGLRMGPWVP